MKTYSEKDIRRFYTYVAMAGPDECWEWLGCTGITDLYGRFWFDGRKWLAHRFAFWFAGGVHPEDLCVCHSCDNCSCVNPAHLWLGTQMENIHDSIDKGRWAFGEKHGRAKLTEVEALAVRRKFDAGGRACELAQEYSLTPGAIRHIVSRRTWQHI